MKVTCAANILIPEALFHAVLYYFWPVFLLILTIRMKSMDICYIFHNFQGFLCFLVVVFSGT